MRPHTIRARPATEPATAPAITPALSPSGSGLFVSVGMDETVAVTVTTGSVSVDPNVPVILAYWWKSLVRLQLTVSWFLNK